LAQEGFGAKVIVVFLIASLFATARETGADVYKYLSPDGVECYTDAPVNSKAVLYLRELRTPRKERKTAPSALAAKTSPRPSSPSKARPGSGNRFLPVSGTITSTVGLRHDPFDGLLRNHNGVDIAVPEGTPVRPVAPGVVTFSGSRNGYGNMVIVDHENGMITVYAHNRFNIAATGDRVDTTGAIALTGSTGRSTGPHLHFEAWLNGVNITTEFLEGLPLSGSASPARTLQRKKDVIRKVVMADGAILLTNLPLSRP